MIVITEGHRYELKNFEPISKKGETQNSHDKRTLQFIHKEENKEGELETITNGTTNEEVLKVLIDRMKYLQRKASCRENAIVITKLEESLMWLNKRTEDRIKRNVEGTNKA